MLEVLDDLREEMKGRKPENYPYAEWERKREIVKERLGRLPEYVEKAASMITVAKTAGQPKEGTLAQRTMLFLFARLMNKSNRDVEDMMWLFGPLFGLDVSYKTVERLYSDPDVKLVLHNLFVLLLRDEDVSGDMAGDGTGYTLTVSRHYRSDPKKKGKAYRYAFRLIDLRTGMYVGVGYSAKSEMKAFHRAMEMVKELSMPIDSVRLDKYFSSRRVLELFGEKTAVYLIPKKNISNIGLLWAKVIKRIIESPLRFITEYFMRNLAECGHSSDKRRLGWIIRQKREDRQEMAMFSTALFHNLFFIRMNLG